MVDLHQAIDGQIGMLETALKSEDEAEIKFAKLALSHLQMSLSGSIPPAFKPTLKLIDRITRVLAKFKDMEEAK